MSLNTSLNGAPADAPDRTSSYDPSSASSPSSPVSCTLGAPSLSIREVEPFFTDGEPLYPAGAADPADAGRLVNLPARPHVAGEIPPALRSFLDCDPGPDRDALVIRLMRAAERLAASRVLGLRHLDSAPSDAPWCLECQMTTHAGALKHGESCRVGAVLAVIDELRAHGGSVSALISMQGKEDAAGNEGAAEAGDGIRPRGALLAAARMLREAASEEIEWIAPLTMQCGICGSSATGLDRSAADIVHASDCWVGNALLVVAQADLGDFAGDQGGAR